VTILKPCPFCGEAARFHTGYPTPDSHLFYPQCGTRGCPGAQAWVGFLTDAEAARAWNRRPDRRRLPRLRAAIDILRNEVRRIEKHDHRKAVRP
jgi:hypothetical protein